LILERSNLLHFRGRRRKVDYCLHLPQGIAESLELGAMLLCSKKIGLDRSAARHGLGSSRIRTWEFYQSGVEGFFEMLYGFKNLS
jgi:hypothetical protein